MSWEARGVATVARRASLLAGGLMGWMEVVGTAAARGGAEGRWPAGGEGGADEGGAAPRGVKAAVRSGWWVVEGIAVEVKGGSVGAEEESGGGGGGRGGDTAGERRDPSNDPPLALQAVGVAPLPVGSKHCDEAPACVPVSAVW